MTRFYILLSILLLSSLACGQIVTTPIPTAVSIIAITQTPTMTPTPIPSPTAPTDGTVTLSPDTAQIVAPTVNVRQTPDGTVIGTLKAGDAVTVLGCGTDPEADDYRWCSIAEPSGYVWQGCLSINDGLGCEAK